MEAPNPRKTIRASGGLIASHLVHISHRKWFHLVDEVEHEGAPGHDLGVRVVNQISGRRRFRVAETLGSGADRDHLVVKYILKNISGKAFISHFQHTNNAH
jgi:hypothetical protein